MNNEYERLSKSAAELIRAHQQPRRAMNKVGKIIEPGDKDFNEDIIYPWTLPGEAAGFDQKNISIEIHGFVVIDRRAYPNTMIFKNVGVSMIPTFKPPLSEEPRPFESYKEAKMYIESLHLPESQAAFLEVTALAPDPGFGRPKPDHLIITTKKELDNL